jgi:hypothetical protein
MRPAVTDMPDAAELDNNLKVPAEIVGVENDDQVAREMDAKYGPRNHDINLQPRKAQSYNHLHAYLEVEHPGEILLANIDYDDSLEALFLTEQMSLERGLKTLDKAGADAVVKEIRQLD